MTSELVRCGGGYARTVDGSAESTEHIKRHADDSRARDALFVRLSQPSERGASSALRQCGARGLKCGGRASVASLLPHVPLAAAPPAAEALHGPRGLQVLVWHPLTAPSSSAARLSLSSVYILVPIVATAVITDVRFINWALDWVLRSLALFVGPDTLFVRLVSACCVPASGDDDISPDHEADATAWRAGGTEERS